MIKIQAIIMTMTTWISNKFIISSLLLTVDAYLLNHPNILQYWQFGNINNYQ